MKNISARIGRAIPRLVVCGVVLGLGVGLLAPVAAVAEPDGSVREADRHFQRGVALYVEADYRGALVEFERAYTLAPNGIVLFNVGETQYQLRDYAAALATFEHYLVEVHRLGGELSLSSRLVTPTDALLALGAHAHDENPHRQDEPYRNALVGIYARLAASAKALAGYVPPRAPGVTAEPYGSAAQFRGSQDADRC